MAKLSLHNNSKLQIANNAKEWVCPNVPIDLGIGDMVVGESFIIR